MDLGAPLAKIAGQFIAGISDELVDGITRIAASSLPVPPSSLTRT
jgi:hypothetical protein